MKVFRILLMVFLLLGLLIFIGPRASYGPIASPEIRPLKNLALSDLDAFVANKENEIVNIRSGNEARIVWADSSKSKTKYAVVYLHGFSASHEEGNPIHLNFAKRYGFNLYLSRLSRHGLAGEESMTALTPNDLIESAKEAIAIGQLLGDDVIVVSTSTGGTLSIYLAGANPELIDAMILFSPNIEIADQSSKILTMPWGLQLGKLIAGEFRGSEDKNRPLENQYWTAKYRIEAIVALQSLLDVTMTQEVFSKIRQPYLLGYYYKNEIEKDPTVSIEAILRFDKQTTTPSEQKYVVAFSEVGEHVLASYLKSRDLESVEQAVNSFAEEVLELTPKVDVVGSLSIRDLKENP